MKDLPKLTEGIEYGHRIVNDEVSSSSLSFDNLKPKGTNIFMMT